MSLLVKKVQSDQFGALSYSIMRIFPVYVVYLLQTVWKVANVSREGQEDDDDGWWDGTAKFPKRDHRGKPLADPTTLIHRHDKKKKVVLFEKIKKVDLDPMAQKLIERIGVEFKEYCGTPTERQLVAMACNPLSVSVGFQWIQEHQDALKKKGYNADHLHVDFKKKAFVLLYTAIKVMCSHILGTTSDSQTVASATTPEPARKEDDEEDYMAGSKVDDDDKIETSASSYEVLKAELAIYMDYKHDWSTTCANDGASIQLLKIIGTKKRHWIDNWEYISEAFDVMKWWEAHRNTFPNVYIVACHVLATPDSNANQERTFSAATWFDGKLSNRQNDATFQMRVLLYKNAEFIKTSKITIAEQYKIMARENSLQLLKECMDAKKEEKRKQAAKEKAAKKEAQKDNSDQSGTGEGGESDSDGNESVDLENDDDQILKEILMAEYDESVVN
jgi:hypothetical protein